MAEGLTFPVLKVDDIVTYFQSEILTGSEAKNFNKNDIVPTPKTESIQRLYMRILQFVFGIKPEYHYMMPVNENVQHSVLQESFLPICSIYHQMSQFLQICQVYDFQLSDLLNPRAKRTITILCGIINFLQFRKMQREVFMEHLKIHNAAKEREKRQLEEIREAELKIKKLTTIPPEQRAAFEEISSEIAELEKLMNKESQEVGLVNEQIAQLRVKVAEQTKQLSFLKVQLATLDEEQAKLKSQIVESPEEMKNDFEKMKETVKKIKQSMGQSNVALVEYQNKFQASNLCKQEFMGFHRLLLDLQVEMDKCNSSLTEIRSLKELLEKQKKEIKNLSNKEACLKRSLHKKMDQKTKHKIKLQKKQETHEHYVQCLLSDINVAYQKREEFLKIMEDMEKEIRDIKLKKENTSEKCDNDISKCQLMYTFLMDKLDTAHECLSNIKQKRKLQLEDLLSLS
ncbi:kinetochore protein Nuf2 [Polypterus senegalus]|uniref:kinetochore protein Nuf2 n=1 Tax=Polypterus senegalus TaxID=55291 RepID=UPI001963767E|nr:kinetochore protein Nuf2 [Polypterus senegalus]